MNKTFKQIALFMIIALIIVAIFSMNKPEGESKVLIYSEFIEKVNNKEISLVMIENAKRITGFYKENKIKENTAPLRRSFFIDEERYDFETTIP